MYGTVPITTPSRVCSAVAASGVAASAFVDHLREAEVEHLHPPVGRHHHVGGLEVAVDDASLVRRGERVGDCFADGEEPIDGQATFGDEAVERLSSTSCIVRKWTPRSLRPSGW